MRLILKKALIQHYHINISKIILMPILRETCIWMARRDFVYNNFRPTVFVAQPVRGFFEEQHSQFGGSTW